MNEVSKRLFLSIVAIVSVAMPLMAQEARVGNLTGHATEGKKLYRRYCIGCHGPLGDVNGENAT